MANVWDEGRQVWVDDATGNYMQPTDRGGDGLWYSPNGQSVFNASTGQWYNKASGAVVPTGSTQAFATARATNNQYTGGNAAVSSTPDLYVQSGLPYIVEQQRLDLTKETNRINNEAAAERLNISNQAAAELAAEDARLQRELQEGRLEQERYLTEKQMAQQAVQFAETLALQKLEQETNAKIQQAQVSISALGESRAERQLQASLAANPNDIVAYQFLMRGLQNPMNTQGVTPQQGNQNAWDIAQQMAQGSGMEDLQGVVASQQPSGANAGFTPPPGYGDSTMQGLAEMSFGGNNPNALYNPYLGGVGAFGANIQAPNNISRAMYSNMSPTDLGILNSFLKAGIRTDSNNDMSRVALNPEDYISQMSKSFIPTFGQTGAQNTYTSGMGF